MLPLRRTPVRPGTCRRLASLLALALGGLTAAAGEWRSVAEVELAAGRKAEVLGFDETGRIHWLETDSGGEATGTRVRFLDSEGEAKTLVDGLARPGGRPALLAWRGRCYLATPPAIHLIDLDAKGRAVTRQLEGPSFATTDPEAGFGGLTIGPDGRIYGSFHPGTATAEDDPGEPTGFVFRFEPDGGNFELIHRGLRRPSAPVFDEACRPWLLDAGLDPRWSRLLDGGYGRDGVPLGDGGTAMAKAAMLGDQVMWLSRDQGRVALLSAPLARPGEPVSKSGRIGHPQQRVIVDLASDWNGTPHLLCFSKNEAESGGRLHILAHGGGAPGAKAPFRDPFEMAKDGDPAALMAMLAAPERRLRWSAAWAMGRQSEGLPLLRRAMVQGGDRAAAAGLAGIGIIARLGHGLAMPGDDPEFRPLPELGLARQAAESAAAFLSHAHPARRAQALSILASARRPAGLVPFGKMLHDPDPAVRGQALLTIGRLRRPSALDLLPSAENPGAPEVDGMRLADALDATHGPEQLLLYSRHGDRRMRLAAIEVLRRRRHPQLGYFAFDTDAGVAARAVLAMERLRLDALDEVLAKRVARGIPDDWPPEAREAARRGAARAAE